MLYVAEILEPTEDADMIVGISIRINQWILCFLQRVILMIQSMILMSHRVYSFLHGSLTLNLASE